MPRVSRSNITSKFIHVITQGIEKEKIFQESQYKQEYINLLNKIVQQFKCTKILAFCIMDNHAHLLIYTDEIKELSKIMSKVNTAYGIFYNSRNSRVGYVFRNRYYTQEILDEKHLFNTFVYIHRNPVKAKIVLKECEYKYSSYNYYVKNLVDKKIVKLLFDSESYLKRFYYIHKNFSEENILEIKGETENTEEKMHNIVIKFCDKYSCNLNYIRKDNYLLVLLIKEIKNNCDATNKLISQYMKIGKNRISSLIKNNK